MHPEGEASCRREDPKVGSFRNYTKLAETWPGTLQDLVRQPSDGEASVSFVNVGQGDCVVARIGDYTMLVDGGHASRAKARVGDIRALVGDCIDLLIGTHYDGDHLAGLAYLVKELSDEVEIRHAFIPPLLHPAAATVRTIRGLADELTHNELDLGATLRVLDEQVADLAEAVAGVPTAPPSGLLHEAAQFPADRPEMELARSVPSLEALDEAVEELSKAELNNLAAICEAAAVITREARQQAVDPVEWWAALLHSSTDGYTGAAAGTAANAVSCVAMNKLIEALSDAGVPFSIPVAPGKAEWIGEDAWQFAQLAPTEALINERRESLPIGTFYLAMGLPSKHKVSNQLSYIWAVRRKPVMSSEDHWDTGVLLTGDSLFDYLPTNADLLVQTCSLIKIPHHGGSWGSFGAFYKTDGWGAVCHQVVLHTTIKECSKAHPSSNYTRLIEALRAAGGPQIIQTFANAPAEPAVAGCKLTCPWPAPEGPAVLRFVLDDANRRWSEAGGEGIVCTCT